MESAYVWDIVKIQHALGYKNNDILLIVIRRGLIIGFRCESNMPLFTWKVFGIPLIKSHYLPGSPV